MTAQQFRRYERIVKRYAELLRLSSWKIQLEFVGFDDINYSCTGGEEVRIAEVEWNIYERTAILRVVDPQEPLPDGVPRDSVEYLIVHELLHLLLAESSISPTQNEQVVCVLTPLIISAGRSRRPCES